MSGFISLYKAPWGQEKMIKQKRIEKQISKSNESQLKQRSEGQSLRAKNLIDLLHCKSVFQKYEEHCVLFKSHHNSLSSAAMFSHIGVIAKQKNRYLTQRS